MNCVCTCIHTYEHTCYCVRVQVWASHVEASGYLQVSVFSFPPHLEQDLFTAMCHRLAHLEQGLVYTAMCHRLAHLEQHLVSIAMCLRIAHLEQGLVYIAMCHRLAHLE